MVAVWAEDDLADLLNSRIEKERTAGDGTVFTYKVPQFDVKSE